MINIFKSLWHLRHVICNNHDGSAIAILLLLLCVSLPLNAQKKTYPDTPEERIQYIKDEFGGIPLIICNEKELSIEKFAELDLKYFGTCVFLNVKSLAEELAGEKGKNGLIYLHAEREHFPTPAGGYFRKGDFPAEFSEGEDSLFFFLKKHHVVPAEVLQSDLDGLVVMTCYLDEEGKLEKCEPKCIELYKPQPLRISIPSEKTPQSWILDKKAVDLMDKIIDSATNVTKLLPPFKPATFFLRHVKYIKDLEIPIRYDTIDRERE